MGRIALSPRPRYGVGLRPPPGGLCCSWSPSESPGLRRWVRGDRVKLLIVRLSSFGDVVHALPLAANAREAGAEVAWLVEPAYRGILEADPDVSRVFVADTKQWRRSPLAPATAAGLRRLRRALRDFAPDRTLDVQGLWKSAFLARSAGAPVIGFAATDRKEPGSALLCHEPVRPLPGGHVVDRNLALVEAAGIPIRHRSPDARFLLSRPAVEAESFLAGQPTPFALYHPGAGKPEKAWGEERFAALATLLATEAGLSPSCRGGRETKSGSGVWPGSCRARGSSPSSPRRDSRTSQPARRSSSRGTRARSTWPSRSGCRHSRSSGRRTPRETAPIGGPRPRSGTTRRRTPASRAPRVRGPRRVIVPRTPRRAGSPEPFAFAQDRLREGTLAFMDRGSPERSEGTSAFTDRGNESPKCLVLSDA